ncbi:hypothetical protein T02_8940 [Trichinella nativa]|uniref:Uncharacterized protein n=1 Tax=Trichinella nativa TaxID=6335 RepID=A0A0V1KLL9_9BILA|nr:hypothetical protein T02_8940 [Trichinella nativa]
MNNLQSNLGRCATLRATFLPGVFFLLTLFDLERDRNDCKHVGQIISEGASPPSNCTADGLFCNFNLDDGTNI